MLSFVMITGQVPPSGLDEVLDILKKDPDIVLQVSYDGTKEEIPNSQGHIVFLGSPGDDERVWELLPDWQWYINNGSAVREAPDNNSKTGNLTGSPGFIDHRIRQPELKEGMPTYLVDAAKGGTSFTFNMAAAVLLKEANLKLLNWRDYTHDGKSGLHGLFMIAATDSAVAQSVEGKLPGWHLHRWDLKAGPGIP